ncbi:hypothetical protein THASP1DRAFT_29955 [Thamnocephalis sphaerospora]|uniref:Uncharacterized protein n=1 Tax=Thamnocephalis sphaerospora TaxID=78915 RepID=A0A4P9XQP2_9FUNG|nr:hypothetical protein THASP1DRAFT_29955 [Thamnocephalis sphaerospora]|eukprot:RKP08242.1 hypothetical protein THASP1DRAFT_29955 [Thamnocephalis sphaerospora]
MPPTKRLQPSTSSSSSSSVSSSSSTESSDASSTLTSEASSDSQSTTVSKSSHAVGTSKRHRADSGQSRAKVQKSEYTWLNEYHQPRLSEEGQYYIVLARSAQHAAAMFAMQRWQELDCPEKREFDSGGLVPSMLIHVGTGGEEAWQHYWRSAVSGLEQQRRRRRGLGGRSRTRKRDIAANHHAQQHARAVENVDMSDTTTDDEHDMQEDVAHNSTASEASEQQAQHSSSPDSASSSSELSSIDQGSTRTKRQTPLWKQKPLPCWIATGQQPSMERVHVYQWRARALGTKRVRTRLPVRLLRAEWLRQVDGIGVPIRPAALITLNDVRHLYWYTDTDRSVDTDEDSQSVSEGSHVDSANDGGNHEASALVAASEDEHTDSVVSTETSEENDNDDDDDDDDDI